MRRRRPRPSCRSWASSTTSSSSTSNAAEQPRIDRARPRRELGVERRRQASSPSSCADGVKWHDGKPFTAADVKCTWDMLTGKSEDKLRTNPRNSWYRNLDEVTTNGDREVDLPSQAAAAVVSGAARLRLHPGLSLPRLGRQMRTKPIGTGPFKFVEFKPNEHVKLARNPGLLEKGPALSRRHRISRSCRRARRRSWALSSAARHDVALRRHHPAAEGREGQAPNAICETRGDEQQHQPDRQPRRAAVRQPRHAPRDGAQHRPQVLHRHHQRGPGRHRRRHAAAAQRRVGPAAGDARDVPGYGPDVEKNRAEAAQIMEKLGYGPDKRLKLKVSTRNTCPIATRP